MITYRQDTENLLNQYEIPKQTFFVASPLLQHESVMSGFQPCSSILVLSSRNIFIENIQPAEKEM